MCHLSRVTCHMSFFLFIQKKLQSDGASRWSVCYQRGLPRLVWPYLAIREGEDQQWNITLTDTALT